MTGQSRKEPGDATVHAVRKIWTVSIDRMGAPLCGAPELFLRQ